jgi:AcrR family transcriptional regulator
MKTATRPYRMGARAEAAAATRQSITDAFVALFAARHYDEITLELVAAGAGVSVQTVIRHFGSKDELFAAVAHEMAAEERGRRSRSPVGDPATVIRDIVAHYERMGDIALRLLAQEGRLPALREAADVGRAIHRDWVQRAFGPGLTRTRHGQLVALTDVYVWKLLRRDLGFGRRRTEEAMTEMVSALLQGGR